MHSYVYLDLKNATIFLHFYMTQYFESISQPISSLLLHFH